MKKKKIKKEFFCLDCLKEGIQTTVSKPKRRCPHHAQAHKWLDIDFRKRHKESLNNPEVKEKHSKALKRIHTNPMLKAQRSKAIKQTLARPEVKEKLREAVRKGMLNFYANPENRQKRKEIQNRPEVKKKRSESVKKTLSKPEVKEKMRLSHLGPKNWKYNPNLPRPPFYCIEEGCNKEVKGPNRRCPSHSSLKNWQNTEFVKNWQEGQRKAARTKPNSIEKLLKRELDIILPNIFKYVGNGIFWVDTFNPDFIAERK